MNDANPTTGSDHGAQARKHLGEAGTHLRDAGRSAGEAFRGTANAARSEFTQAGGRVRDELGQAAESGRHAAEEAGYVAGEKLDEVMARGRDFFGSCERFVRERPMATFGGAFLAGYLLAKLTRRR